METFIKGFICVALIFFALWAIDKLLLWMEDSGWIFYRRKKPNRGSIGNAFLEVQSLIEPGTKVIWQNTDDRRHMITNKRIGLFRQMRKSLEYMDTFEYTFNETGVYEILEANFGINGKIIVEEKKENIITGNVIKQIEVNGVAFLLTTVNIFAITMVILIIGFYMSRPHKKKA